jgi:three-Cys-motif partner protein
VLLCVLDPYGLHLDWDVIFQAGQSRAIDLFLNFPVMDVNRDAIWHNPANSKGRHRTHGKTSHGAKLLMLRATKATFSGPELVKQDTAAIVKAFQERLQTVAGFEFVPDPLPMRNSNTPSFTTFSSPRRNR